MSDTTSPLKQGLFGDFKKSFLSPTIGNPGIGKLTLDGGLGQQKGLFPQGSLGGGLFGGGSGQQKGLFGQSAGATGATGGMGDVTKMGIIGGLGGIASGLMGSGKRRAEQREATAEYDKMRTEYEDLDTSNIYANVQNQYANLENPFEDLTINQKQAQFEAQQGAQQRANIMQGLQGAAGGSGIAGLAQAMANQAQLSTQRASASIGLQESQQQRLMAQQAGRIQMAERGGEAQAEQMRLAGAESARGLEWQKTGTLLGMAQQRKGAADQARADANAALWGGVGQVAGSVLTGGIL